MVPGDRGGSEAGDEVVLDAVGAGGEEARDEVMAVGPTSRAGEDGELVAQQEVLRDEIGAGAEGRAEEGDEQQRALHHQRHDRRAGSEWSAWILGSRSRDGSTRRSPARWAPPSSTSPSRSAGCAPSPRRAGDGRAGPTEAPRRLLAAAAGEELERALAETIPLVTRDFVRPAFEAAGHLSDTDEARGLPNALDVAAERTGDALVRGDALARRADWERRSPDPDRVP